MYRCCLYISSFISVWWGNQIRESCIASLQAPGTKVTASLVEFIDHHNGHHTPPQWTPHITPYIPEFHNECVIPYISPNHIHSSITIPPRILLLHNTAHYASSYFITNPLLHHTARNTSCNSTAPHIICNLPFYLLPRYAKLALYSFLLNN